METRTHGQQPCRPCLQGIDTQRVSLRGPMVEWAYLAQTAFEPVAVAYGSLSCSTKVQTSRHGRHSGRYNRAVEHILSFDKLIRVVSWCRRFYYRCRQQAKERSAAPLCLTSEEVASTKIVILRLSQQQSFPDVYQALLEQKTPINKVIQRYCPYLDKMGLVRVGGRLGRADVPHLMK